MGRCRKAFNNIFDLLGSKEIQETFGKNGLLRVMEHFSIKAYNNNIIALISSTN